MRRGMKGHEAKWMGNGEGEVKHNGGWPPQCGFQKPTGSPICRRGVDPHNKEELSDALRCK